MKSEPEIVQINTADKTELQMLPGIGPRLAERIIHYRHVGGNLTDLLQLAQVPGISRKLAQRMTKTIDWSIPTPTPQYAAWLKPTGVLAAFVVTGFLLVFLLSPLLKEILSQFGSLDGASIALISITINIAVLLLTFGSMALAFFWAAAAYLPGSNGWPIRTSLIITALAFMVLLVASVLGFWMMPNSTGFLSHGWRMMPLVATVAFIVYILYGPQLIVLTTEDPLHLVNAARLFDLSLLPLAIAVLALCYVESGDKTIFHLFVVWAGTMFMVQGLILARKGSCFKEGLETRQADETASRTSIQLLDDADPTTTWRVRQGQLLVVVGATLVLYAAMQLMQTVLTRWV